MNARTAAAARADRRGTVRGAIMLMVVVLTWGTLWPVNKALLAYFPPLWSIAARVFIASLTLFAIALATTGIELPRRRDVPVLISMVVLHMVGFTALATLALQVVPAGRSTILAYTCVLWAPLGAAVFLGERISLRRALGLGVGLLGLIVIFNPLAFDWRDSRAIAGNGALLAGAVLWSASIVHNRGHRWEGTPFLLAPWQLLLAAAMLALIAYPIEGPMHADWNAWSLTLLLFAAIPGTAIAYWAASVSSTELPAATTAIGLLGVPAVSIVVAMGLLGEQPTPAVLGALALLLAGVAIGVTGRAGKGSNTPT